MPLTPCWPPPVITSISCLGGWSSCCLDSWRLRTQRPPFNGSENRKLHGRLSMAYNLDYQNRWSDDPDNSLQLAQHNAEQAIEKDPNEPFARLVASWSAMFEKDLDRAKSEANIALSLNPNFSGAYASLGSIHTYSGRPIEAIEALERATRLDPAFRSGHLHFLGMSYLLAGKYETAAALLRERILLVPGTDFSRVLLASALGH